MYFRPVWQNQKVHCKLFEDNSGALQISRINKNRPHTKQLNKRLRHFQSYVDTTKEITIHPINKKYQPDDVLTKEVNVELMTKFRKIIIGW